MYFNFLSYKIRLKENLTSQKLCTKWAFLLQDLFIYVKMFPLLVLSSTSWNMSRSDEYLVASIAAPRRLFAIG